MKRTKKDTPFTKYRNIIRAVFALSFYTLVLIPHLAGYEGFEIESEYIVSASILVLGPWFCGWACPFGNASYFMSRLGALIFPQLRIPNKLHHVLKYLKYALLVYFLSLFIIQGINYFGDHMLMYKSNWFTLVYIKFKHIAVLLIPLFIPRFFCKYLCFQKAAYNLMNYILPSSTIQRETSTCVNCKKCDRVCPMQINISDKKQISGQDCLSCFNCLDKDVCPPNHKSLSLQVWGKNEKQLQYGVTISIVYLAISLFLLFLTKYYL